LEADTRNKRIRIAGSTSQPALDALPPPNTTRWVPRRKAEVLAAIANGHLTLDDACARYSLSVDELAGWQRLFQHGGVKGLRATRVQDYRAVLKADTR